VKQLHRTENDFARRMQARIGRLQGAIECLCYFLHAETLNFEQHEDFALGIIQLVQGVFKGAKSASPLERDLLRGCTAATGWCCARLLVAPMGALAVIFGDSHADPIKPGAHRRTAFEIRQFPVNDDEHLLAHIFHVRIADTEVQQRTQGKSGVLFE